MTYFNAHSNKHCSTVSAGRRCFCNQMCGPGLVCSNYICVGADLGSLPRSEFSLKDDDYEADCGVPCISGIQCKSNYCDDATGVCILPKLLGDTCYAYNGLGCVQGTCDASLERCMGASSAENNASLKCGEDGNFCSAQQFCRWGECNGRLEHAKVCQTYITNHCKDGLECWRRRESDERTCHERCYLLDPIERQCNKTKYSFTHHRNAVVECVSLGRNPFQGVCVMQEKSLEMKEHREVGVEEKGHRDAKTSQQTYNNKYTNQIEDRVSFGEPCHSNEMCMDGLHCLDHFCLPKATTSVPSPLKYEDLRNLDNGFPCLKHADCASGYCTPRSGRCARPDFSEPCLPSNKQDQRFDCPGMFECKHGVCLLQHDADDANEINNSTKCGLSFCDPLSQYCDRLSSPQVCRPLSDSKCSDTGKECSNGKGCDKGTKVCRPLCYPFIEKRLGYQGARKICVPFKNVPWQGVLLDQNDLVKRPVELHFGFQVRQLDYSGTKDVILDGKNHINDPNLQFSMLHDDSKDIWVVKDHRGASNSSISPALIFSLALLGMSITTVLVVVLIFWIRNRKHLDENSNEDLLREEEHEKTRAALEHSRRDIPRESPPSFEEALEAPPPQYSEGN